MRNRQMASAFLIHATCASGCRAQVVCADAMGMATRAKLAAAAAADADVDAAGATAPGCGGDAAAGPTFFVADTASDMWQVCMGIYPKV